MFHRLPSLVVLSALVATTSCSSLTAFLYQGRLEHGPRESNGQQTGQWKYWYDADHLKVRAIGNFERDKPVGRWEFFHENGAKRWEVSFANEAYDGASTAWWPNGNMRSHGSFEAGLETGPWIFWNEAGEKHAEGSFVRGARDDDWLYYPANGATVMRYAFERGAEKAADPTTAKIDTDSKGSVPNASSVATAPATPAVGIVAAPVTKTQTGEGQDADAIETVSGFSIPVLTQIYMTGEAPPASSGGGYPAGDPRNPPSQPKRDDARSDSYVGKQLGWTRLVQGDGRPLDLASYRGKSRVLLVILRGLKGRVCEYCAAQTQALQSSVDEFRRANCEIVIVYPGPSERLGEFVSASREYYQVHYGTPQPDTACKLTCDDGFQMVDKLDLRGDLARPAVFILDEQSTIRYSFVAKDRQDRPACKDLLDVLKGL